MKKPRSLTGLILVLLMLYAVLNLQDAKRELSEAQTQTDILKAELQSAQDENERLTELIINSDSDEAIEELAREKLGLVKPDETVFVYTE